MTKTNIVPAVGTDDEVTRKNSTISSHYFGYGGGHLLKFQPSQRATVSPALVRASIIFFKILNLPSIRHLQKMSATNFQQHPEHRRPGQVCLPCLYFPSPICSRFLLVLLSPSNTIHLTPRCAPLFMTFSDWF